MTAPPQVVPARARVGDVFRLVMAGPAVSDAAVRLWLLYRAHHIDGRGAYLADDQAAKRLGCSTRKVQRVRGELVHVRALVVVKHGPNPPSYYPQLLADDSPPLATQDSPPMATQAREDSPQDSPPVTPTIRKNHLEPKYSPVPPHIRVGVPLNDVQGDTPPPPAAPKAPEKLDRDTWLTPFGDAWRVQYGGEPFFGQIAKALKPLVDVHGADDVLERWRHYLAETPARYTSPQRFASTFGQWSPAADPAVARALRERDRAAVTA